MHNKNNNQCKQCGESPKYSTLKDGLCVVCRVGVPEIVEQKRKARNDYGRKLYRSKKSDGGDRFCDVCDCKINHLPARTKRCPGDCAARKQREYMKEYQTKARQESSPKLCDVCGDPLPAKAGNAKRCAGACREIGLRRTRRAQYQNKYGAPIGD